MRMSIHLAFLLCALHIFSCSRGGVDNGSATRTPDTGGTIQNQSGRAGENRSPATVESGSQDRVLFDGKNYIKKDGWLVPSRTNAYIDDTYSSDEQTIIMPSEGGKDIKVRRAHYIYKIPWSFSEDFSFVGSALDYRKGKIESDNFLESSYNGTIFMYSIFGIKTAPLPDNAERHEDPFMYMIQDRDGDGIFETLIGSEEIKVPKWVLK